MLGDLTAPSLPCEVQVTGWNSFLEGRAAQNQLAKGVWPSLQFRAPPPLLPALPRLTSPNASAAGLGQRGCSPERPSPNDLTLFTASLLIRCLILAGFPPHLLQTAFIQFPHLPLL